MYHKILEGGVHTSELPCVGTSARRAPASDVAFAPIADMWLVVCDSEIDVDSYVQPALHERTRLTLCADVALLHDAFFLHGAWLDSRHLHHQDFQSASFEGS